MASLRTRADGWACEEVDTNRSLASMMDDFYVDKTALFERI